MPAARSGGAQRSHATHLHKIIAIKPIELPQRARLQSSAEAVPRARIVASFCAAAPIARAGGPTPRWPRLANRRAPSRGTLVRRGRKNRLYRRYGASFGASAVPLGDVRRARHAAGRAEVAVCTVPRPVRLLVVQGPGCGSHLPGHSRARAAARHSRARAHAPPRRGAQRPPAADPPPTHTHTHARARAATHAQRAVTLAALSRSAHMAKGKAKKKGGGKGKSK